MPAPQSCLIVGRFLSAVIDSADDPDREPEIVPIAGAKVTLTASVARVRASSAEPPATIFMRPIECMTDETGQLVGPDGIIGVRVIATDDETLDPHGWTWTAVIAATGLGTISATFSAPGGGTVDLTTAIPVSPSPGAELQAWTAAVATTTAARDEAVAAAAAVEAVLATNDGVMAAVAADPQSAFVAVQNAAIAARLAPGALTVSPIAGAAQYTTIQAAVDAAQEGDTILIFPGTYREQVAAWTKPNLHLRGVDKHTVILIDSSGDYATPPLEIGSGSVSHMTIIEDHADAGTDAAVTANQRAYCIHPDNYESMIGRTLVLEDLVLRNTRRPVIGMGNYMGTTIIIRRVDGWSGAPVLGGDRNRGALYMHNASSATTEHVDQNVIVEDCTFTCADAKALYIYDSSLTSGNMPSDMTVRVTGSTFWSEVNGASDIIGGDGFTANVSLHGASFGNNLPELNAHQATTLDEIAGAPAYQGNADVTFASALSTTQPLTLYAVYSAPTAGSGVVIRHTSLSGGEIFSNRRNGAGTAYVSVGQNAASTPTITAGAVPAVACSTMNGSTLRLHVRGVGMASAATSAWPSGVNASAFGIDVQTGVAWYLLYVGVAHNETTRERVMQWLADNYL